MKIELPYVFRVSGTLFGATGEVGAAFYEQLHTLELEHATLCFVEDEPVSNLVSKFRDGSGDMQRAGERALIWWQTQLAYFEHLGRRNFPAQVAHYTVRAVTRQPLPQHPPAPDFKGGGWERASSRTTACACATAAAHWQLCIGAQRANCAQRARGCDTAVPGRRHLGRRSTAEHRSGSLEIPALRRLGCGRLDGGKRCEAWRHGAELEEHCQWADVARQWLLRLLCFAPERHLHDPVPVLQHVFGSRDIRGGLDSDAEIRKNSICGVSADADLMHLLEHFKWEPQMSAYCRHHARHASRPDAV
eukprot:5214605-Prymnesium_polylepis.2